MFMMLQLKRQRHEVTPYWNVALLELLCVSDDNLMS